MLTRFFFLLGCTFSHCKISLEKMYNKFIYVERKHPFAPTSLLNVQTKNEMSKSTF